MARPTLRTAQLAVSFTLIGMSSAVAQTDAADIGGGGQASVPATNDREAARAAFERGLSLVRESRYAEAKAAFLEAYQAYPHYLVLYNVAQADVQLGNLKSAITYLERFLREGADVLSAERRRQVSEQTEELRRRLSAEHHPTENDTSQAVVPTAEPQEAGLPPAPQQASELPPHSAERPPSPLPPSTTPAVPESATRLTAPFVAPTTAPVQPAAPREADKTWGLLLGATGIALLGVASGLYLWNDSRHEGWKQDRQALDAIADREQALASDLDLWRQARANNALLESIERVDVVTIIAAGVGVVALGAGTWEVLAKRAPTPALIASHPGLSWRSSW